MSRLLLLALLCGFAESDVVFTHSTLYDQYDIFQLSTSLFPKHCGSGCSIYASIPPDSVEALREARNVIVTDGISKTTLFDIAGLIDEKTTQKKSYDFPASQLPVFISYTGNMTAAGPLLVYVFSNEGKSNIPFEVYEARTMKRSLAPARIVTILSPEPFTVGTDATQLGNTVYSYAAGMDNAIEYGGPDDCVKVFELRDQGSFPGFVLNVQLPILSFYFNMDTPVQFYTRIEYSTVAGFDQFLSSPGFVGCYGMKVYRSSLYTDYLEHTVSGEKQEHLRIDATLNTNEDYPVTITDVTHNKPYSLWGEDGSNNAHQSITLDSQLLLITWMKKYTRSAFLLRFTTLSNSNPDGNPTSTTPMTIIPTTSSATGCSFAISLLFTGLLRL